MGEPSELEWQLGRVSVFGGVIVFVDETVAIWA